MEDEMIVFVIVGCVLVYGAVVWVAAVGAP